MLIDLKKARILIFLLFFLSACSNDKVVQPDSPMNASALLKQTIDQQNYESFQQYFYEGTENNVSKEQFMQYDNISTAGTSYKTYELITFDNGEMLLVEFSPRLDEEDDYEVVNVKQVPDEMKVFFE